METKIKKEKRIMTLLNDNAGKKKTKACGMTKDQMIEAMRKINAVCNDKQK